LANAIQRYVCPAREGEKEQEKFPKGSEKPLQATSRYPSRLSTYTVTGTLYGVWLNDMWAASVTEDAVTVLPLAGLGGATKPTVMKFVMFTLGVYSEPRMPVPLLVQDAGLITGLMQLTPPLQCQDVNSQSSLFPPKEIVGTGSAVALNCLPQVAD
jgi:hypothetical protein